MARYNPGIAARPGRERPIPDIQGAQGPLELPVRFHGHAHFTVEVGETVETFGAALRQVARPEIVTATDVQAYCQEHDIADERMELAVLREAFRVVSREVLLERLVDTVLRRLTAGGSEEIDLEGAHSAPIARGSSFTDRYRGMVFREADAVVLRLSLGSTLEPPLAFTSGRLVRARARHAIPVSGTLRLEGSFTPLQGQRGPAQMRVHWRVGKGADVLDTRAIHALASPLEEVVACVGAGALARFAEAIPDHLATLARADRGPAFVHVERLFRLGRVTEKTRAYLLFWQRLRDYLLWRVRAEIR